MKRSTAIGHLVSMGEEATDRLSLMKPLKQMWVTGDLLSLAETLDRGSVVLVLDVPPDKVPWLAIDPDGELIGYQIGLGKRPMQWCYRPAAWPVWNYQNRRVARFWARESGLDTDAIEALRSRRLDRVDVIEPSPEQLAGQLREELAVSRDHLRSVLDNYWDRDWRRRHKGYDQSPEDHLWRAATAVSEILDALDDLEN